jgi:hypothetical protein
MGILFFFASKIPLGNYFMVPEPLSVPSTEILRVHALAQAFTKTHCGGAQAL